jgi:uncharacterized protein (TIGR03435 family)
VDADCAAAEAERTAAVNSALDAGLPLPATPRIGPTDPLPPCFLRIYFGRMEGQLTMDILARALQITTRPRQVVNKTGLSGSYQVSMEFDDRPLQSGPPLAPPEPGSKPSLLTALPEQLGLRLVPWRTTRPTLIVDRLERPTEN